MSRGELIYNTTFDCVAFLLLFIVSDRDAAAHFRLSRILGRLVSAIQRQRTLARAPEARATGDATDEGTTIPMIVIVLKRQITFGGAIAHGDLVEKVTEIAEFHPEDAIGAIVHVTEFFCDFRILVPLLAAVGPRAFPLKRRPRIANLDEAFAADAPGAAGPTHCHDRE